MARPSEILRAQRLAEGKTPQDSAEVATLHRQLMNTPGLTYPLKENRFMMTLGNDVPYYLQDTDYKADIPTISVIAELLDYKKDKEGMEDGRTSVQKFLDDFPKDIKKNERIVKSKWGDEGWEYVKKAWQQATLDKMNQDIKEGYEKKLLEGDGVISLPLVGDVDLGDTGKAVSRVGSRAMKFFTPRRYEAVIRGEDPTWKDNLGDVVESGLMAIPAGGYVGTASKVFGRAGVAGKVAQKALANKYVGNLFGNAFAPFAGEFLDDAMRDENDPNTERQDWSLGDALMGTATNLGINFGLARGIGGAARLGSGELSRGGGSMERVRKVLEGLGKSRAERGLGPAIPQAVADRIGLRPSLILDEALDRAGSAAPTLFVNRLGQDRDADLAFNMAGFAIPGGASPLGFGAVYGASSLKDEVKKIREDKHKRMRDRKTKKEVGDVINASDVLRLDERDLKYLNAVRDNPYILEGGYAPDNLDFNLWLLERGHEILKNTSAHRPLWEVKVDD